MTEDITSLQIRILYDSVTEAERRLRELERTGGRMGASLKNQEKSAASLMGSIARLAAGYITLRGVISGFQAVIRTTAEFQQLNAQLVTATGSAAKAKLAFAAIKDFATQTPYDLQQATGAFIALVNRGLDPSERALRSYGDTASSMGFSLADMVLAVSNATAGEFENLKKFGIRAQKEGDNVKFTFRGVTESVKNDIASIESYFIKLGESSFAGGMERQMDTLTGAMSNLGDAWEVMLNAIGEAGLGDAVEDGIRQATEAIVEFTSMIESGQIGLILDSWATSFDGFGLLAEDVFDGAGIALAEFTDLAADLLAQHADDIQSGAVDPWDGVQIKLSEVPTWFSTMARLVGATIDGLSAKIYAASSGWFNQMANASTEFHLKAAGGNNAYAERYAAPKGPDGKPLTGAGGSFKSPETLASEFAAGASKAEADRQALIGETWTQTQDRIAGNWDSVIQDTGDQLAEMRGLEGDADAARAKYEAGAAERAKDRADRLAQFRIGNGQGGATGTGGGGRKGGGGGGGSSEFDALAKKLNDEESLISESYARRFALIEANTAQGSMYQAKLELSLTDQFQKEQDRRVELLKREPETMLEGFALEEKLIEDTYAKRKDIILNATEATEAEKLKMLTDAELQYTSQMRKHETERNKMQFGLAADFFGNLATMAGAFGKKGTKIAKAAAIAQTTIKTYESATSAYAALAGIPYIGPALGAAAAGAAIAAGFANVQAIKAQDDSGGYAGAFATGGFIPAGKYGIAGESGPEFVQGPAMITSAASTADRLANPGAGGASVEVNIVNMSGEPVTEKRSQQGDKQMIEFIIGQAKNGVAEDISKGGTAVAKAIERTYNMGRGGKRA